MTGDYFEVSFFYPFQSAQSEEILIATLKRLGVKRDQIVQTLESRHKAIRIYLPTLKASTSLLSKYQKAPVARVRVCSKFISYANWAEKWKEDYEIQALGKSFVVVPAWRLDEYRAEKYRGRISVVIDPLSAFGSGEHETTRLVTRVMETLRGRFSSFLDVGTGTGILSVFAAHLGARRILGFDCDKPSAECAKFNFHKNISFTVESKFQCLQLARLKIKGEFELVTANINSHILENFRNEIVRSAKKGGWVLVSGILRQTYRSFRQNFDGKDLRCQKVLRGRRWVAILYRKQ